LARSRRHRGQNVERDAHPAHVAGLFGLDRDRLDVLMLERHEQGKRRATDGGELVLADEMPRKLEILLRTMEDTYASKRLQTTVSSYPGSPDPRDRR
jgi:hypothetical protein